LATPRIIAALQRSYDAWRRIKKMESAVLKTNQITPKQIELFEYFYKLENQKKRGKK